MIPNIKPITVTNNTTLSILASLRLVSLTLALSALMVAPDSFRSLSYVSLVGVRWINPQKVGSLFDHTLETL